MTGLPHLAMGEETPPQRRFKPASALRSIHSYTNGMSDAHPCQSMPPYRAVDQLRLQSRTPEVEVAAAENARPARRTADHTGTGKPPGEIMAVDDWRRGHDAAGNSDRAGFGLAAAGARN